MKLTILSYGSRGDVQPFIALSVSLLADGFEVTLAAPENFKGLITSYGIPYAPLAGDFHAMFSSEEGQRYLRSGSTVKFLAKPTENDPPTPSCFGAGSACRLSGC